MNYLMITIGAFLFSLQFMFNEAYSKESGNSLSSTLKFLLYSSITGFIALLAINKFDLNFSWFSFGVAAVFSLITISLTYSSIKAFSYVNLSVYSVFMMIGGMLLPFIYGVLINGDEFKIPRLICCLLIVVSVALSINKGGNSKKAIKYYIMVFILNGLVGVVSSFHQSNTALCVDSGSFLMISMLQLVLISIVLILLSKNKSFKITGKAFSSATLCAVANNIANLLLFIALANNLPPSVQYPIVTGGTIVFSTLIVIVRREKITIKEIIAAGIALVASVFMAF